MKPLFKEISFGLNAGDKKGLIAKNGAGKSTLMQILVGRESADAGRVVLKNGITLAYLDQSDLLDESQTILETIFDSKKPVMRLLARYEEAMTTGRGIDAAIADVEAAGTGTGTGTATASETEHAAGVVGLALLGVLERVVGL
ncbi:MAG TPA: ATP-binding cassette domain-containing protein, partial [Turneriella sp.]|nr:ATP-binding cassette domain-containing protein [Turneriella sp.]